MPEINWNYNFEVVPFIIHIKMKFSTLLFHLTKHEIHIVKGLDDKADFPIILSEFQAVTPISQSQNVVEHCSGIRSLFNKIFQIVYFLWLLVDTCVFKSCNN